MQFLSKIVCSSNSRFPFRRAIAVGLVSFKNQPPPPPRIRLVPQKESRFTNQKPQSPQQQQQRPQLNFKQKATTPTSSTLSEDKKLGKKLAEIRVENPTTKPTPKLQVLAKKLDVENLAKMEEIKIDEDMMKSIQKANIISTVTQTEVSKESRTKGGESSSEKETSWQTMKLTFVLFGVSFAGVAIFLLMELGKPKVGDDGKIEEDEFSGLPVFQQYVYRTMGQLDYYKRLINEPSRDKLLPDELKYPYHQPPYTLVLELKDVLVHPDWTYGTGWRFKKRPGIDRFLETLNGVYEIVIYTAELGMTVFPILEALDPNNLITYKLVRDATNFVDGKHVKDLDKLNRPLKKVVLVDWDEQAIANNRDNALLIPRWTGDDDDTALLDLANLLRVIAISEIQDVREVLTFYKEYENPLAAFRDRQRELERTMYKEQHN